MDIPKDLENELKTRGLRWQNWSRTTEDERNKAEDYYINEVMPLLIELFIVRERPKVQKKYQGMFLSLGTSFEPLVLSISALQPEKVCFLYTEKSRIFLDPIIHFTGLVPSRYEIRKVDKDNPLQIYKAIKEVYQEWGQPQNIALDFTGGTKSMSGGSAMAGGLIGADMVYIASSNYITNLRRPFPGSEHLEFIPNPYQVFGDLEEEKAFGLYAQFDYTGAYQIFKSLEKQVPDPRRYTVLSLLCRAYEAWDNLDIPTSRQNMSALVEKVQQYSSEDRNFILAGKLTFLERQLEALNCLEKSILELCNRLKPRNREGRRTLVDMFSDQDLVLALMFTLYGNALRREVQGKYDMASLLLYRLLELISQARLAYHGLDTVKPRYSLINEKDLLAKLNTRYKRYNNNRTFHFLPDHISLFQGYMTLAALDDELTKKISLDLIRQQVNARNYNIFAHGFDLINADRCQKFKEVVKNVLKSYLLILGLDISALEERYRFVDLT